MKVSLAWMLVVPFILQVMIVVGLVGYLAHRNGQRSVENLTSQLVVSVSRQIQQKLNSFLAAPQLVNQLNDNAVQRGELTFDLSQPNAQREQYLWQQMQLFQHLTWVSLGSEQGSYLGVWRKGTDQPLQIAIANADTQALLHYYATNSTGERASRLNVERPEYDPRLRPWYQVALQAGQTHNGTAAQAATIYPGFTTGTVFLSLSQALYDRAGKLLGVSSVDLSLLGLQAFLEQNRVSATGKTFLMERSGLLVASSSQEPPFRLVAGQLQRVNVLDSATPLIQATAQLLHQQTQGFATIQTPQQFRFQIDHQSKFVEVLPFSGAPSLDWLIVIVVPESDVMAQVNAGTQTTILLCGLGLFVAIALNIGISRWLVKPIQGLSRASQQIALGDFSRQVSAPRIKELSTLAQSFQDMSQEIQQSRQQLEDYSRSLEQQVNERTQSLQQEIEQRIAAEVALQAANRKLQQLAYLDGLTQIPNRRQFDEQLNLEWRRMQREQRPLSLILCDVDYFKQYNDTYGHQVGDDCLRAIASAIAAAARRPSDLPARYGGEEFAVLLPNTTLAGALEVAQMIQKSIEALKLPHQRSAVSAYVTASFGVASLTPTPHSSTEQLLTQGDQALYQAKIEGRDRIRAIGEA